MTQSVAIDPGPNQGLAAQTGRHRTEADAKLCGGQTAAFFAEHHP